MLRLDWTGWTGSLNHLTIRAPQGGANKLNSVQRTLWKMADTLQTIVEFLRLFRIQWPPSHPHAPSAETPLGHMDEDTRMTQTKIPGKVLKEGQYSGCVFFCTNRFFYLNIWICRKAATLVRYLRGGKKQNVLKQALTWSWVRFHDVLKCCFILGQSNAMQCNAMDKQMQSLPFLRPLTPVSM